MRFSVIIPTYNRSVLLIETINSVLSQTFLDYELIIVNDGSTDNTSHVLQSYGNKIIIVNKENSGGEKSRNAGAERASGKYLCFLDSDDLFFPWTLEVYDKIIKSKNYPPLVLGQPIHFNDKIPQLVIDKNNGVISFATYKDYFSKDRSVYSSSSMIVIKREYFFQLGGFKKYYDRKDFFLDDIDFMLRAGTISPAIIVLNPFQFAYRTHSDNSVKNLKKVLISMNHLLDMDIENIFAGGKERAFERHAIIGGPSYYWLFKALRHGILMDSLRFSIRAYPYIAKGLFKKVKNSLKQKKELETLPFN
ncbi:MAG: glycosyltransferase family 2 protein [Ignavibacteriota bacterium]